jgi:RHS repeat-associated protein
VTYGYTNGNLTTLTTPSGKVVTYGYAQGRVTSIAVDNTVILDNVQYDPFGPVTGWTWGNNTLAVRSFDLDGRVTLIDSAGLSVYGYHDDGTIARRNDDEPASFTVPGGSSAVSVSPTSNRITGASGTLTRSYTYDAMGNTLATGETIHTYNHRGRMKTGRLASTSTDTEYLYNALGQRIRKTGGPAGTVRFAYDEAGHLIGEYNGSNALIQETIWLGDIPVATLRPDGGGYQVFYVHTDHLNTPRRVSRPSDNAVLWRWASDAYGEALPDEDADGDTSSFVYNLRFPGQYFDVETALSYNYFRDYDPALGRYVESDPVGLEGGINTYLYADADPMMFIDPDGREAGAIPVPRPRICIPIPGWLGPAGQVAGAGWLGWEFGSAIYPHIGIPLGDAIDAMCRVGDKSKECDKEWEDAYRDCRKMLASPNPPRGVTGGYTNLYDCARGLVSEECGGNATGPGSSSGGKWRGGRGAGGGRGGRGGRR